MESRQDEGQVVVERGRTTEAADRITNGLEDVVDGGVDRLADGLEGTLHPEEFSLGRSGLEESIGDQEDEIAGR